MSLLTPVKVPVKVYRWDDAGAPALDKTAGCMMTIFKACLVTGYGTKDAAGWTMPFEDMTAKVKVLRPEVGPHTDFYLRCSADNGSQMTAQVYLNMTAQNKGTLKLQCATPFKYGYTSESNQWVLVASPRGFWFFSATSDSHQMGGHYFFVGDMMAMASGERPLYLQHTGGTASNSYSSITGIGNDNGSEDVSPGYYLMGKFLAPNGLVSEHRPFAIFNGTTTTTSTIHLCNLMITQGDLAIVPGLLVPSRVDKKNLNVVSVATADHASSSLVFGSSSYATSNFYVLTTSWIY